MSTIEDSISKFGSFKRYANMLLRNAFVYIDRCIIEIVGWERSMLYVGDRASPGPNYVPPKPPDSIQDWINESEKETIEEYKQRIMDENTFDQQPAEVFSLWHRTWKIHDVGSYNFAIHVILLATLIETVINRHLFFLRETGELTPELYKSIDRAEVLPKIMYSFKKEIKSKKLHVSRIRKFISLRNKAVHFKKDGTNKISMTAEELILTWEDIGKLLALCPGEPTTEQLQVFIDDFKNKWFAKKSE
jgi:hypothetical protein